jgi:alpha-L-rhamnosidase
MRFSYHEIQFITITGLGKAPDLADVTGYRLTVKLTRTGHFDCSNKLITKIYDTTVKNYRGITTGGMTVDCPHRERRGYGGDGHTSYQFALDNFNVGSYFTKWARDFADVQKDTGDVPHTAPTVGGGGGPAWSGFVVTLPYQMYTTYGDTSLLESMYPTMVRQLAFYDRCVHSS